MLNITHTYLPSGEQITYQYGMPKPQVKCYGEVMKRAVMNEVRKNGIANEQLSLVAQAQLLANQATEKLKKIYTK